MKEENQATQKSVWSWLLPLILIVLALWFFWKLYQKNHKAEKQKTTVTITEQH